jgi:hypothetical protein
MASPLLLASASRFGGKAEQQMAQTVTEWLANEAIRVRPRPVSVTVRVWRRVAGVPQGLFTFAGAVDAASLRAVLQQVERLTRAVPGRWRIEVIASGLDTMLLHDVNTALRALQRLGLRSRLALAPRQRPDVRLLLAHAALALMPPTLPH